MRKPYPCRFTVILICLVLVDRGRHLYWWRFWARCTFCRHSWNRGMDSHERRALAMLRRSLGSRTTLSEVIFYLEQLMMRSDTRLACVCFLSALHLLMSVTCHSSLPVCSRTWFGTFWGWRHDWSRRKGAESEVSRILRCWYRYNYNLRYTVEDRKFVSADTGLYDVYKLATLGQDHACSSCLLSSANSSAWWHPSSIRCSHVSR